MTDTVAGVLAEMRAHEQVSPRKWVVKEWADRLAAAHEREVGERDSMLAQCFKLAGADSDGNVDSMIAPRAIEAVRDLRLDYDAACDELHGPNGWKPRAEAAEALLRECSEGGYNFRTLADRIARIDTHLGAPR